MTAEQVIVFIVFPLTGYFLGSIPFAWVIGKLNGVDIRTTGSKNIGATNLGRTLGARFFWYAFMLDAAKGFFPVLATAILIRNGLSAPPLPMWSPLVTAAGCVLGHVFPIWLKFKGGKGVATGFGVVLGFWPLYTVSGLIAGLFFVFVLMVYRYISLASMSSAVLFACLVALLGKTGNRWFGDFFYVSSTDWKILVGVAALFAAMIIWRHRTNIIRLTRGTEPRIGQREIDKAKMQPPPDSKKP